mmetsp:Transcript_63056/g.168998  ORF Transcript_63056/g.168998 Transcript_63056/m.168998 type:complete len:1536 (+) Transcript_63056:90-4697(+)
MPGSARLKGTQAEKFVAPGSNVISTYRHGDTMGPYLNQTKDLKVLETFQHEFNATSQAAKDAASIVDVEETKLRELRSAAMVDPNIDPQKLFYQEQEVEKAWERLTAAEQARDAAELRLHRQAEKAVTATKVVGDDHATIAAAAPARQSLEVKRAQKKVSEMFKADQEEQQAKAEAAAEKRRLQEEADKHQGLGKKRLAAAQKIMKERDEELRVIEQEQFDAQAKRLLQLKKSVVKISNAVHAQNERRRKKQQALEMAQEQEKKDLLSQGFNPYEVFRRRELEEKQEQEKIRAAAMKQMRAEQLLERLGKEDEALRVDEKKRQVEKAEAKAFQREMNGNERRRKVTEYMQKVTIGGQEILDPTRSAIRIDPSKVSLQVTNAFGLGRAEPEIVGLMEGKVTRSLKRLDAAEEKVVDEFQSLQVPQDDDDGEGGEGKTDGGEKFWEPKLSKLEQQYMAQAMERQKNNITSVQRCWGKEFKGDAFLAKPSTIIFKDFVVGQRYKQVVEVTNVSLTFNQFKLLPLDEAVRDFFEIKFQPPGRMSAGVTCTITIWFVPKLNEDIYSEFPILAKTGRIAFPLQCTTRKTVLTILPQDSHGAPLVDFGKVLRGEFGVQILSVKNSGALTSAYRLEMVDAGSQPEQAATFLSMVEWEPSPGEFTNHETTKIKFKFTPEETCLGTFEAKVRLVVDNPLVDDFYVVVKGECIDVPIYVEEEQYDFKTVVYDHIFRHNIVLRNRYGVPMKINVERPKEIEGELSLNPRVAYVQGHSQFIVQVKFQPRPGFLDRNRAFRDLERRDCEDDFRIPVRVKGADQVLPVCCDLIGTLTSNDITFEPEVLNFGPCYVEASVSLDLTITNHSLLPQKFAFCRLPSFLTVRSLQDDPPELEHTETAVKDGGGFGGFGVLLPEESMTLCVQYSPESAVEMHTELCFKVQTGALCSREFAIPCLGQGQEPIITLKDPFIKFAAIPKAAVIKASIELCNVSKSPQMFNILEPPRELGKLYICPLCAVLQPKARTRVQVEFKPDDAYVELLKKAPPPPPPKEPVEGESPEPPAEEEEEDEEAKAARLAKEENDRLKNHVHDTELAIRNKGGRRWEAADGSVHALWKIALCTQVHEGLEAKTTGKAKKKSSYKTTYIGVRTCCVPAVLTAAPQVLDFGEITLSERKILHITLENLVPSEPQNIRLDPLPETACFAVLNAARPVKDKPFQLAVEFKPQYAQIYKASLRIFSQSARVEVQLQGKGVRPILAIEPDNGVIQFGAIVAPLHRADAEHPADMVEQTMKILNNSGFTLEYELRSVAQQDKNHTGVQPFTVTPATGAVAANGSQNVTVAFQPHQPCSLFREKMLVHVADQPEPQYLYLYGSCFEYQNYVAYDVEATQFDKLPPPPDPVIGPSGKKTFHLSFKAPTGEESEDDADPNVLFLKVGSCVPPGTRGQFKPGPGGNYDFVLQPNPPFSDYFAVENGKGAVQSGATQKIGFRYKPPTDSSLQVGGLSLDLLDNIGQWITATVKGTITGGFVPPDMPAAQEVFVELKAYLKQI